MAVNPLWFWYPDRSMLAIHSIMRMALVTNYNVYKPHNKINKINIPSSKSTKFT